MRQIGGNDDQRLGSTPQPLDDLGDLAHAGVADGERREGEGAELALQEGQLHLERVLLQVGAIARHDLRQVAHRIERGPIDGHGTKRRGKRIVGRHGKPAHRHAVHRPEHHHAADDAARRGELVVGACRDGTGIDVTRVGHDERFRKAETRLALLHAAEELFELGRQRARIAGIERPGDGSRANGRHIPPM